MIALEQEIDAFSDEDLLEEEEGEEEILEDYD